MDCEITEANKKKLTGIAEEYNRKIIFVNMNDYITKLKLNMGAKRTPVALYLRLFLSSVIPPTYDKVLYLDCDTIILDSLRKLWDIDMTGYMVAGVKDTVERYYFRKIGLFPSDIYINSGVLLVNLAKWREENIVRKFIEFIDTFDGNVPHHDQGVINAVCNKKKLVISPRYNVYSNMFSFSAKSIRRIYYMNDYYTQRELDIAKKHPAILHFTTGLVGRPWEEYCTHPMKDEFIKVVKQSPWNEDTPLPDSRRLSLKVFTFIYKNTPRFISETVYRIGNRVKELAHI